MDIRGHYGYILPCGGIVTSVEARGFCGRPDNVELRLLSAKRADHAFKTLSDVVFVPVQCNKTATVNDYYEGYVSNTSLNIHVQPGHMLVVYFNPDCGRLQCYFEPAVINNASNYDVVFADSHLVWSVPNMSLFFSANITGAMTKITQVHRYYQLPIHTELPDMTEEGNIDFHYVVIGILCFLMLCATVVIIALAIMRGVSKMRKKTLDVPLNV